jgi:hypothetical protein
MYQLCNKKLSFFGGVAEQVSGPSLQLVAAGTAPGTSRALFSMT